MKKLKYAKVNNISIDLCLTKDPYVNAAHSVVRFRGAHNWSKEGTNFVDVVVFAGEGADLVALAAGLKKADRVIVTGRYRQVESEYNGRKTYSQEIACTKLEMNVPEEVEVPDDDMPAGAPAEAPAPRAADAPVSFDDELLAADGLDLDF